MDLMLRRRELMAMQSELPSAYRKVEYLEYVETSTKKPYIDLNEYATIDCEIGIDCYITRGSGNQFFMGCRGNGCCAILGIQPKIVYQFGKMSASIFTKEIQLNSRHRLVANNIGCYLDNEKIYDYENLMDIRASSNTIKLFASSASDNSVQFYAPAGFKVYSAYIKKNGVYTKKLIPCVRKSDSKPGMYDTVSKTFYTNAGSGEFDIPT